MPDVSVSQVAASPSPRRGSLPVLPLHVSPGRAEPAAPAIGATHEHQQGRDKRPRLPGHGTIVNEVLGFRPDYIEHQLAHAVSDPNGRAYNRTAHLPERRRMMPEWANYLDKLKAGTQIVQIHQCA